MKLKSLVRSGPFLSLSLSASLFLAGCNDEKAALPAGVIPQTDTPASCASAPLKLEKTESLVSIVATNDMHGAIEPKTLSMGPDKPTQVVGGMAFWAGAVKSIRDGVTKRYGTQGGTIVLDGGDQFQGTLLSNYSEGALMFNLMNEVGYDAAVPGNHDYDFGPAGWLQDQVTEETSDKNPRGVIQGLAAVAKFPLLSSNTYLKASLKTVDGKDVVVDSVKCATSEIIDWTKATRPSFLKQYLIKNVGDVRVAVIGLDNPATSQSTTFANVSDLCFRPALETYKEIRESLEGKADVFVAVIHDGDINQDLNLTKLLTGILEWRTDGIDALVGGHTHMVNLVQKDGVYGIQSGANGERFGRIDLVYDRDAKKVVRAKTRVAAGATLFQQICDSKVGSFCEPRPAAKVAMECENVVDSENALTRITDGEKLIASMAKKVLGFADAPIKRERDFESPLLNLLTDALRNATGTDVAMINTGGVRTDLAAGTIYYENLYQVSPFNNRAVILSPMKVSTLVKLMNRSAQSCGKHGSVLASGIRAVFHKGACVSDDDGLDKRAHIVSIALNDGTVLYDARDPAHPVLNERDLKVATLDFLATGGSGFDEFKEAPVVADAGIFRELVATELAKSPTNISAKVDGRWVDEVPPGTAP